MYLKFVMLQVMTNVLMRHMHRAAGSRLFLPVCHNLGLLPVAGILDALGHAVQAALHAGAEIPHSVADGLSVPARGGGDSIPDTPSRGAGYAADGATDRADSVAQGRGQEVEALAELLAGVVVVLVGHCVW